MKFTPKSFKHLMNLYPPFFFTRTRVKYVAPDWRKVVVVLKKSLLTKNYVGTTFGGSLYQAADPFFMLMLVHILGIQDYVIWDQSAEITFVRPARSKITYTFEIKDEDLENIREGLKKNEVVRPVFRAEGLDKNGDICVVVKKVIYIRKKGNSSEAAPR